MGVLLGVHGGPSDVQEHESTDGLSSTSIFLHVQISKGANTLSDAGVGDE